MSPFVNAVVAYCPEGNLAKFRGAGPPECRCPTKCYLYASCLKAPMLFVVFSLKRTKLKNFTSNKSSMVTK